MSHPKRFEYEFDPIKAATRREAHHSTMEIQLKLVQTMAQFVRGILNEVSNVGFITVHGLNEGHIILNEAMVIKCSGCLLNHPSQIHHECLMVSVEDRISLLFGSSHTLGGLGESERGILEPHHFGSDHMPQQLL